MKKSTLTGMITSFVIIPSFMLIWKLDYSLLDSAITFIEYVVVMCSIIASYLLLAKIMEPETAKRLVGIISATYYTVIYILIIYWLSTGTPLDLAACYDFATNLVHLLIKMLSFGIIFVLILIGLMWWIFYRFSLDSFAAVHSLSRKTDLISRSFILMACMIVLMIFATPDGFIRYQVTAAVETADMRIEIEPFIPLNNYSTSSDESIFMLQLESTNALIIFDNLTIENITYDKDYAPVLRNISRSGIFFPYHYGNSIQTNRAQVNILCGINGNIRKPFSFRPDEINTSCLPELLKDSGYKTIMFRADDLKFANTGKFMRDIGFEEVHYDDIMGDAVSEKWGYDDCIFYKKAFEYLKENYPEKEKLFVYFEVSSHHIPWKPRQGHENVHVYADAENFQKKYLNSLLEQDYCIGEFMKDFEEYENNRTHLMILSDHSWPLGMHGNTFNQDFAYNENFLTPFLYIPPNEEKDEFRTGKTGNEIHAHTDIIPTVFGLLNHKNYPNSFVYELKKGVPKEDYEDCQLLVQPYCGGKIAIVDGDYKYVYDFHDRDIEYYNLKEDWHEENPLIISTNTSFEEFRRRFYCQRYR